MKSHSCPERREVEKHCEIGLPQRHTSSEISQILERINRSPAQASFVRCICGVDKRQESSEDACRPCDRSAAASASSRRAGRHETSIDGGGEQAHRSLKQRGSPPLESRGSKHPPQTRRPQPLRPPSRRAGPRAVAAPSPAFSSRKVSQFSNFNLGTCIRRPDRCWGALAGLCAREEVVRGPSRGRPACHAIDELEREQPEHGPSSDPAYEFMYPG